ncbi:MAG: signal peptidase II [Treponema sp. GWB1_62_6]|nr:MAG: signal peptidase II [Treponema sp. GWB1_62_6]OHE68584.1 MAG: signal peptidase II [Treponema sp. RIFOXYC1_FULL_61_9]HCM26519.1 signal peptidase II [Treponema sp.]
MKNEKIEKLIPFLLAIAVIAADQLSKAFIVSRWPGDGVFISDVFGNDFLWIIHVRNKAIAFSIGRGLPDSARAILFIALPIAVLAGLVWYYFVSDEFIGLQRWAIAGIVGGGIGNLIDRVLRSDGVVDFISVNFYGMLGFSRWPTFNIADSSVVVCGILLFASVLFSPGRRIDETTD